jgi:signal transduction histidine kinase
MKVKFFQRLSTRISVLPMLFVLSVLIAGGALFYISGYRHMLGELPKQHLMGASSGKRLSLGLWIDNYKRELDGLSRLDAVRDNVLMITGVEPSQKSRKRIADAINHAQASVSRLLLEKTQSGRYKMLAVVSKDGRVIACSIQEMTGEDWSDRAFIRKTTSEKITKVLGIGGEGHDYGVIFLMPVLDMESNVMAFIYAVSGVEEAASLLMIDKPVYKTEKIEIIDEDGNVVLTKDGAPGKRPRYNIPGDSKDMVRYKDGLFFYTAKIENTPLRLISTAVKSEIEGPFNILFLIYFSMLGIIVLTLIVQNSYIARKAIAKPIAKLVNAIRTSAMGNMELIEMGKGYKGEMLELKNSLEHMIEELKRRESILREEIREKEKSRLKSSLFSAVSHELRHPLSSVIKSIGNILDNEKSVSESNRKEMEAALAESRNILQFTDELVDLSRLEDKKLTLSAEDFDMRDLLKEIEEETRPLIGLKEIGMVFDCGAAFDEGPVHTDRQRLKQIITNLVINAVKCTDVGTITALASKEMKDNIEYLELSVADTGKGMETGPGDAIFDEFSEAGAQLGLAVVKKLAGYMGGGIVFESMPGKGSVFTVTIPVKAIVYQ